MPTITESFVDCILAVDYKSLPRQAVEVARTAVLDMLAVSMAGLGEPLGVGRLSLEYARSMGSAPQASVIGGGFKCAMPDAAYANGTLAHALDYDSMWYPLNPPASPTLPAIFALAEHHHLSGASVIEAIVAAFELQGRIRLASTGMAIGTKFHKPGVMGVFGATTGAIKLLKLNREQALMALGLAGSRAGSLALNAGTMTKSAHAGHSARMGVECAVLAQLGWTASADVFGPKGYFDTFMAGVAKPDLLIEGFGAPFRMVDPGVGFKLYPANYFTHRPIDAALALRAELNLRPEQIDRVEVIFPHFEYINRPSPDTGLDGKFSVQYATLIALLDGDITIASFTNERRFSADVVELLPRVKFVDDHSIPQDLDKMHTIVTIWLKDGRSATKRVDRLTGWLGTPPTREQWMRKYALCTENVLEKKAADRLLELIERIEELPEITEIMDIVRC